MLKTVCLVAVLTALTPAVATQPVSAAVSLDGMRGKYRPLLVFHPAIAKEGNSSPARFAEQLQLLEEQREALKQRDVLVVPIPNEEGNVALAAGEEKRLRRRFQVGPDEFALILIGKDGGEKFRSQSPVTIERLDALIDAMPMRQQEVRDGHHSE